MSAIIIFKCCSYCNISHYDATVRLVMVLTLHAMLCVSLVIGRLPLSVVGQSVVVIVVCLLYYALSQTVVVDIVCLPLYSLAQCVSGSGHCVCVCPVKVRVRRSVVLVIVCVCPVKVRVRRSVVLVIVCVCPVKVRVRRSVVLVIVCVCPVKVRVKTSVVLVIVCLPCYGQGQTVSGSGHCVSSTFWSGSDGQWLWSLCVFHVLVRVRRSVVLVIVCLPCFGQSQTVSGYGHCVSSMLISESDSNYCHCVSSMVQLGSYSQCQCLLSLCFFHVMTRISPSEVVVIACLPLHTLESVAMIHVCLPCLGVSGYDSCLSALSCPQ